jgi:hypothetical protein
LFLWQTLAAQMSGTLAALLLMAVQLCISTQVQWL